MEKFEIRKAFDNVVIMRGVEDQILLKLKGTSVHPQNSSYLSHRNEGTLSYSLLWHAIFEQINYENLRLLKRNGVFGLPTILKKFKQCDTCILGEHSKKPFYDSNSRACRKLGLLHSNINKYIMYFIYDYTRMCWMYLLKDKSQDFETLKKKSCMDPK
jgi:hypothetical protein